MPATLADYLAFDDTDITLATQWPVMSRCLQALTPYFQAKIATGTEPSDVLSGMYLGVDGQSTTTKDWRFFVNSSNAFVVEENTGTDVSPTWVNRLTLSMGGGLVSPHATTHQHGGSDEVATATPGANAIPKADGSGLLAAGWLTGVLANAQIAAAAAIAVNKLAALTANRVPVLDANGFLSASSVTNTTLAFLDATSSIQTQLNAKLNLSGGVMTGNLDLGGFQLLGPSGLYLQLLAGGIADFLWSDDGSAVGPSWRFRRDSASPAASDLLGSLEFFGRNASGTAFRYGRIHTLIDSAVAGAEGGAVAVRVPIAGVQTDVAFFRPTGLRLPLGTASGTLGLDANKDVTVVGGIREVLTAARTYYVRSDGSNSNTGLVNSSGGAFLTLQKAIDVIGGLDLSTFAVTIQIGVAGSYAGFSASNSWIGGSGSSVTVIGDAAAAGSYVITSTVSINDRCPLNISGLDFTPASGDGLSLNRYASVQIVGACNFGTSSARQILVSGSSRLSLAAVLTVDGSASNWILALDNSTVSSNGVVHVFSGTPAFSSATVASTTGAIISIVNGTPSGAATGTRYSAALNSVINTNGGGASFFPGNVAGTTATGGQYA